MERVNQTFQNRTFLEICRKELGQSSENHLDFHLKFGIWIWYGREHRLFLSESFTGMMGIPDGIVPNPETLIGCVMDGDQERFLEFLERIVEGRILSEVTFRVENGKRVRCVGERVGVDCVGVCFFV